MKYVIGIIEQLSFPESEIYDLPCKIDTGADTSSIHCEHIVIRESQGVEYLHFRLLDKKHPQFSGKPIRTNKFIEKKIKSSIGEFEYRYQVRIPILFAGKKYNVSFNLTDRSHMAYPVLLGKRFLKNRFVVDVAQHNTTSNKELKVFNAISKKSATKNAAAQKKKINNS